MRKINKNYIISITIKTFHASSIHMIFLATIFLFFPEFMLFCAKLNLVEVSIMTESSTIQLMFCLTYWSWSFLTFFCCRIVGVCIFTNLCELLHKLWIFHDYKMFKPSISKVIFVLIPRFSQFVNEFQVKIVILLRFIPRFLCLILFSFSIASYQSMQFQVIKMISLYDSLWKRWHFMK